MTLCDLQWPFVTFNDLLWTSMTFCELQWPFVTFNDFLWPSMTFCDLQWPFVTFNDLQWPYVTFNDLLWPSMTFCDLQGPFVTFNDLWEKLPDLHSQIGLWLAEEQSVFSPQNSGQTSRQIRLNLSQYSDSEQSEFWLQSKY